MTVSIRHTLSRAPGNPLRELTWEEVARHLHRHYIDNGKEKQRKLRAAERQRLYQCGGDDQMARMVDKVFEDPDVREFREQFLEFTKHNNVLRRVTGEVANVYSLPAKRTVGKLPAMPAETSDAERARFEKETDALAEENRRYREVQRLARQDEVMPLIDQWSFLQRTLAVGARMRATPRGDLEPMIDVVTPATLSAVRDPIEPGLCVGLIFENDLQVVDGAEAPKWTVWTDHEMFQINGLGQVMTDHVKEHGYGRMPYVLFTLEPPAGRLFDEDTGQDLVAAHKLSWFLWCLAAKEAKSSTLQLALLGDISRALRNQADDSQRALLLPEGVVPQLLNRFSEFGKFAELARDVYETTASNYGVASSVLRNDPSESAAARDRLRLPLREQRLRRQIPFRELERQLAEILSIVVKQDGRADLAYTTEGWRCDFADPQTPLGEKEQLEVDEKKIQMGMTSRTEVLMRQNPDITREEAKALEALYAQDKTDGIVMLRDFQAAAGGMPAAMKTDTGAGIEPPRPPTPPQSPDPEPAQEQAA